MPPSLKIAGKTAAAVGAAEQEKRLALNARLNGAMACDTAFRIIARRHLTNLEANQQATANGSPTALHQMRIALTHLRTAILFFSPMVENGAHDKIKVDLKWLNTKLGTVRDLDVAVERIELLDKTKPLTPGSLLAWNERRAKGHRRLARALRSARYRLLMERVSSWIESGSWSTKKGRQAAKERARPIANYSAERLALWEAKLLRKSHKLRDMGPKKRHRLRLLTKKLTYSIDSFEDLFTDESFSKQKSVLKQLRKAQKSLGQLNDEAQGNALATEIKQHGTQMPLQFLEPARKKRLLKTAAKAYSKLATLS